MIIYRMSSLSVFFFFFFKQKTAYEMRISDWSSDVCSSDLVDRQIGRLVERLKAAGAWDSTVIALTSDHGEMMGDHWTLGKFGYFDQRSEERRVGKECVSTCRSRWLP